MFTSRAEYRLTLRADNADLRLTERGAAIGCVGTQRRDAFSRRQAELSAARELVATLRATPNQLRDHDLLVNQDGVRRSAAELLAHPGVNMDRLARIWPQLAALSRDIADQLETEARYVGYLARQEADIRAFRRDESLRLPEDLDYRAIGGLSNEVCTKLQAARPRTLGAAARISGVTPAALTALLRHVRRADDRLSA
jgi:tRNA uridine 5-carboxymethylaminomethyl modification enzyme